MCEVIRVQYRAQLRRVDENWLSQRLTAAGEDARSTIRRGKAMTLALYRYGRQLFLYGEFLDGTGTTDAILPEKYLPSLTPALNLWPQKDEEVLWVPMYPVFWHCEPRGYEDWHRTCTPDMRRGRIAVLRHESMFEYVRYHEALVREGLLEGDRYQLISLHEDLLFSYLEEPRTPCNILRRPGAASTEIAGWLATDPDSHFVHLPGSQGQNFLFIPTVFALGEEHV